jgi:hypothetical protein
LNEAFYILYISQGKYLGNFESEKKISNKPFLGNFSSFFDVLAACSLPAFF